MKQAAALILAWLAALLLSPAIAGTPPLADPVAFQPRIGVNVAALIGPVASGGVYPTDPYTSSAWNTPSVHLSSAVVSQVKAAGFTFVRMQVSVGPCVQAVLNGTSMAALDAADDVAIHAFYDVGVGVVWSPYISGYTATDAYSNYQGGVSAGYFPALITCEQHWASRYANLNPKIFAIDPFNEPTLQSGSIWQSQLLPALYNAVRTAAPNLTQILEVENYDDFNILAGVSPVFSQTQNPANGFDPTPYTNIIPSFHNFFPTVFVYQGAAYNVPYNYLTGVSYPPNANEKAGAIARMTANLNADTTLTTSTRSGYLTKLTNELGYYYNGPQNIAYLSGIYGQVATWAKYWGVRPSNIMVGEYSPVRQNPAWIDSAGIPQGPDRNSRANYLADQSSAALQYGFRIAPDHLDTYDFGLTQSSGANIGAFDPPLLQNIAPALSGGNKAF